jgi:hypothetical protein
VSWRADAVSPGVVRFATCRPGDANEDGRFDALDVVMALQSGRYMSGDPAGWSEGDWNGDGLFDQSDVMAALQSGGYLAT